MTTALRPPAVPLVTIDPYFSVWSMADRLTDDFTRHWTGKRNALTGLIRIDGTPWRFAGLTEPNPENYYAEPEAMHQTGLQVTPLSSIYSFEAGGIALDVAFTSPLLPDRLELLSRPASYVSFRVRSIDGKPHDVRVYFDVTGEWCVNTSEQKVVLRQEQAEGLAILQASHAEQNILNASGDDLRIDWGTFMLAVEQAPDTQTWMGPAEVRKSFVRTGEIRYDGGEAELNEAQPVRDTQPVLATVWDCGKVDGAAEKSHLIVLAYDDVYAIEYFGRKLEAYWKKDGKTTLEMVAGALREYPDIALRCEAFDRQLQADAVRAGGEKYADILALSYRQAIAAHKLVIDSEGQPLFMSKECFSNGCIATVDVSYPSIPLFLLYQPELVRGMMRPIFKYASSEAWPFEFAPHDVGQYPLANGQVYGENAREAQMPVEECGNMLVMAAAVTLADGQKEFAAVHRELLSGWADYLLEYGLDPENQLCTDDFAGHLARNANLSAKAIMGVASYSILCGLLGDSAEADRYLQAAKEMAGQWAELAAEPSEGSAHTKLAFGGEGTWSLKYNLIWDLIFGTHVFDEAIIRRETAWYQEQQNRYGVPLDNRKSYTKGDWLVWAAALAEEQGDFERIIAPLWDFLNETRDRVPFSDWYDTHTARQIGFQHRSVVGGMFIKLLKDRGLSQAKPQ
ncbi:glutaminase domain-containing protein [Paenibacillus macerans]|uniref:glutaminase family protein n=1 Tax=Paenibacillus macerans TaxID=44252 RepID=UPI003D3233D0